MLPISLILLFVSVFALIISGETIDEQLFRAVENGNDTEVQLLLGHGADANSYEQYGQAPLHRAAFKGHTLVAELLLEKGADVNAADGTEQTPLHWAAFKGHHDIVKLLLDKGADVNATDYSGITPLHKTSSVEIANLLVERGADINAADIDGNTPLFWAAVNERKHIVQFLLERGAKFNREDRILLRSKRLP